METTLPRFFLQMLAMFEEAAEVVGVSEATVVRDWTIAKAWLRADLSARAG